MERIPKTPGSIIQKYLKDFRHGEIADILRRSTCLPKYGALALRYIDLPNWSARGTHISGSNDIILITKTGLTFYDFSVK
jgi:hypothetical protein